MDLSVRRDSRVGEAIMDLSSRGITVTRMVDNRTVGEAGRALRPRTARKDYCEGPDVVVVEEDCTVSLVGEEDMEDDDDGVEKPLPEVLEISSEERLERLAVVERLRQELTAEESKLLLLQRIKQLQSRPAAVATPSRSATVTVTTNSRAAVGFTPPPGVSVTVKTTPPLPPASRASSRPQPAHGQSWRGGAAVSVLPVSTQQSQSTRQSRPSHQHHHQQQLQQHQQEEQRQTAAKLALRKQLEKTLLQIPPPKPPPPHISFIPNAASPQFVCLLGLEHAVDYLKNENQVKRPCQNFSCNQCATDFTPVWRRDSARSRRSGVTCEHCYTGNVKKKLKAEHTSRLKAAFVKALQQEQEMEAQLAKMAAPSPVPSPAPAPPTPETTITPIPAAPARREPVLAHQGSRHSPRPRDSRPISATIERASRAGATTSHGPGVNSHSAPAPSASGSSTKLSAAELDYLKKLSDPKLAAQLMNPVMMAAVNQSAVLAAQHNLLRLPAQQQQQQHLFPPAFNPLLYSYQMAMAQAAHQQAAQAAAAAKAPSQQSVVAAQQALAELQRQYLLDMIPGSQHNWPASHSSKR